MSWDEEDGGAWKVVLNDEEQYSVWPQDRACPAGWRETGFVGDRAACLAHIREVWTDMRPLSLRRQMDDEAAGGGRPPRTP